MDATIINLLSEALLHQSDKSMPISSLQGHLNKITKKQRKHIKKTGFQQFLVNNPDTFMILDENVFLIQNDFMPGHLSTEPEQKSQLSFECPDLAKLEVNSNRPSENAVERIKQELKVNGTCLVCSDVMKVYAIGNCFHPICYKCSTKLRVLCDDKHCPVCREVLEQVVFTDKLIPKHEVDLSKHIKEMKYGIYFRNEEMKNKHRKLLEHNCQQKNCLAKFTDIDDLAKHLKEKHGEYFCSICLLHCKILTSERKSYSTSELQKHEKEGDKDNHSFNGHPLCEFCNQRYLDKDELLSHVTRHHSYCHLCDTGKCLYYRDEHALWWDHHFVQHHACKEMECFRDSSTVFKNELDLKVHIDTVHKGKKCKYTTRLENQIAIPFQFDYHTRAEHRNQNTNVVIPKVSDPNVLQIYGIIDATLLHSYYGFILREGMENDGSQNVFFTAQSCDFIDDEDSIRSEFYHGERVFVQAMRADSCYKAKWRAISVSRAEQAKGNFYLGDDDEHYSGNLKPGIAISQIDPFEYDCDSDSSSDFPSLGTSPTNSLNSIGKNPFLSGEKWSVVTRNHTPKVTPTKKNILTTQKPKKLDKIPSQGVGIVQENVKPLFGFIKVNGFKKFDDNVYFNKLSYQCENFNSSFKLDLIVKPGDKVRYILDENAKEDPSIKARYRAKKVWKYKENEDDSAKGDHKKRRRRPRKKKENNKLEKSPPTGSLSSQLNGISSEIVFPGHFVRIEQNYKIFRKALGMCIGKNSNKCLVELETELNSKGLSKHSILFCQFQMNEKTKIFIHASKLSKLSPKNIELSYTGFCATGISQLVASGIKYNEVVFVDAEAGHYLILHKINDKLHSFTLHYASKQW